MNAAVADAIWMQMQADCKKITNMQSNCKWRFSRKPGGDFQPGGNAERSDERGDAAAQNCLRPI
jgi:hypothetical protein